MQTVALSVIEAEIFSDKMCAQDMLFVMHILESMGLKVEKPMIFYTDSKGAMDLVNN